MPCQTDQKIIFSGKITASATHEFQNILAIINENAGLMKDLISLDPINAVQNMAPSISTVEKQVARGVTLLSRLNSFAHTADNNMAKVDIVSLCKNLIGLTRRLASAEGADIILEKNAPVFLTTDAVELQVCFYYALESLFLAVANSTIRIDLKGEESLSSVTFTAEPTTPLPQGIYETISTGESFSIFKASATALGAQTEISGLKISIVFN